MYSASDISRYVISKCYDDEKPISNLQLQKILYYIQRYFIQEYKTLAFPDEIQAWKFGPVVPTVYYDFCLFGSMPITINFKDLPTLESCDEEIIDSIIEEKRELNPWELVSDTHKSGGAWDKVYNKGYGDKKEIPTKLIEELG